MRSTSVFGKDTRNMIQIGIIRTVLSAGRVTLSMFVPSLNVTDFNCMHFFRQHFERK